MELFKLFGSIFIDNDKANESISKTDKKAQGMGATLAKGIKTAAGWSLAIGGAAIAVGGAFLGVANKTAEAGDRIDKLSQKIGLSRQGFQEWEFILSQSGTSIEGLQGGFKKFVDVVDNANAGNKLATEQMRELGFSIEELETLSPEELFNRTVTALQGMEEGTHKTALANDLLGRSASELAPLLNGSAGSVDEMRAKANELGLVIGEDVIDASVAWTDTMDQLKRTFGAFVTNLGGEALPLLQKFGDFIMENMPLIEETTKAAFEVITIAVTTTVSTVKSLTQFFQAHWNILQPILAGIAAGAVTFGIYTLAINAAAIATAAWTTVTTIATAAGTAFGAVLAFITSPIGLVVIAIGLLVAAGVLLYKNWDTVKEKLGDTWDWIKNEAEFIFNSVLDFFKKYGLLILGIITGPAGWAVLLTVAIIKNWDNIKETTMKIFDSIKQWIVDTFKNIKEFFTGVAKDFLQIGKDIFNNMWDGLKNVWVNISSWIEEKVTWLKDKLTFWKSSQEQMNSGGASGSTPRRANGGSVVQGQQYMVGERGAELFVPNQSGTIVPNNKLKSSVANGINLVINNPMFLDEAGADLIMEKSVDRLRMLGVT